MWKLITIISIIFFISENLSAELKFINPILNDSLECNTFVLIEWTNDSKSPINLYYSVDSIQWVPIVKNYSQYNYNWLVPFTIIKKLFFKIEYSNTSKYELLWHEKNAHNGWVLSSTCRNSSDIVTIGRGSNLVKHWNIPHQTMTTSNLTSPEPYEKVNFAFEYKRGNVLIVMDKSIYNWNIFTNTTTLIYHNDNLIEARHADYNNHNQTFAIASDSGMVVIIDELGNEMKKYKINSLNFIHSVDFSDDGNYLAIGGDDGLMHVVNLVTDQIRHSSVHHGSIGTNQTIWSVSISKNNDYIISGAVDNKVFVWNFNTLDTLKSFEHNSHVRATKFNSNSDKFLSAGLDGMLYQYNTSTLSRDNNATLNHGSQILWAEYIGAGEALITAGRDSSFKVWHLVKGNEGADIVSIYLYQNLELSFPEIFVDLSDTFDIPIKINGRTTDLDSIQIDYFIPIDIANVFGYNKSASVQADEMFTNTIIKNELKSRPLQIATAITSLRKKGLLTFSDVRLYPEHNFRIKYDDGFIQIKDNCDIDTSRFVEISKNKASIQIEESIISSLLKISLFLNVDSYYNLSIYNINGTKVKEIINSFMKNDNYILEYDISNLPSSKYFILLKYEDKILSKQFIKK